MARKSNTAVRRAVITLMEQTSRITALVAPADIYGPGIRAKPPWPRIQYGVAIDAPRRSGQCLDGQAITVAIHSFAKGADETAVEAVGDAVEEELDGAIVTLSSPHTGYAKLAYVGGRTQRDDADASSWHRISNFEIRVST